MAAWGAEPPAPATNAAPAREAAVAGLFYPKEAEALGRTLDHLLAQASGGPDAALQALVVPHAGYEYSGRTAAFGYRRVDRERVGRVILLAPSHYARFRGASVSGASAFRTPLGSVPIAGLREVLGRTEPFVPEAPCPVQRPTWSSQSSRSAPRSGEDTPDTWEHSDEVQVPFLQRVLGPFELLPIVYGEVDPGEVARALRPHLDGRTLVVASSDLSHYHPYATAKRLDTDCIDAICRLDCERMAHQEACGKAPILTVMHLARLNGWKARLLDYRNSGDTGGDKSGVVGYAAIGFFAETASRYSAEERAALLVLARKAVLEAVAHGRLPDVEEASLLPCLRETKGCFVTLTKHGVLRGCIGNLTARGPLYQSILENSRNAALRDPRFPPVETAEIADLAIEVSVLSEPRPLAFTSPEDLLEKLRPGRDGVVLEMGRLSATYLPQVWEQLPDKVRFLDSLAVKAGGAAGGWRKPDTRVLTYEVEAVKESDSSR